MSLILEALKKSEQERRRDKGPDLQTIHQPVAVRAPQRSHGMWWGAALVAVNVAAIGFWWQHRDPVPAATPAPLAAPQNAAAAQAGAVAAPMPMPQSQPQPQPAQPQPQTPAASAAPGGGAVADTQPEYTQIVPGGGAAGAVVSSDSLRVEEVDELPEDVRNNLPAMTFSFHVFSSNPQQRTIIINNRRMREGDEINPGLVLQQITEDGVILLFAQHRIHISVLSGW